jgi:hypothetical protein
MAAENKNQREETMELLSDFLEGTIEPQRFEQLDMLMIQNPEVRAWYLDMIALRTGLEEIFGKNSKTDERSVPLDVRD